MLNCPEKFAAGRNLMLSSCQRRFSRTITTYTSHPLLHLAAARQCGAIWINVLQNIQSFGDPSSKGENGHFRAPQLICHAMALPVSHTDPHKGIRN